MMVTFSVVMVCFIRSAFLIASRRTVVDHYYWMNVARAAKSQKTLPIRLGKKYLLEDERQFYPPGYMYFLSKFPERFISSPWSASITLFIDLLTAIVVLGAFFLIGGGERGAVALIAVYGTAPILAAYNVQLSSRGLGNLFLVIKMLAEVGATSCDGWLSVLLWLVSSFATAGVFLTHKMTTQFLLFSLLFWPFVIGEGNDFLIFYFSAVVGLFAAAAITGIEFQIQQWAAHLQLVAFWSKNWRLLGAHSFHASRIYGRLGSDMKHNFHKVGLQGILQHAVLLCSYFPLALLLPISLFWAHSVPTWIIFWLLLAILAAVLTLLVSVLRGLGAGHLYLFNAAPPAALWWGWLFKEDNLLSEYLFFIGMMLTLASLFVAAKRRLVQSRASDDGLNMALVALKNASPANVAAFPWSIPERIAYETHHNVFWGGHGGSLEKLEPYFPVMNTTLREAFVAYNIQWVLISIEWWPEGPSVVKSEFPNAVEYDFKNWKLFNFNTHMEY